MKIIKPVFEYVDTLTSFYGNDWSNLLIDDVVFNSEDLSNIILPNDPELFQNVRNKDIRCCKLPSMNYSNYNFNDVDISGCVFGENSILPSDTELFQKIKGKNIKDCKLPSMDYSNYNFDGVLIEECEFGENSILP